MPVFQDSENIQLLPEGDAVFTVETFAIGLSTGAKTANSEKYEVRFKLETKDGQTGHANEVLIDHPTCAWKIDTFLKSAGVKIAKGTAFSFNKVEAEKKGWKWVNPLGLRGWCKVVVDEYELTQGARKGQKGRSNKIAMFYTDKEKLPQVVEEEEDCPF